MALKKSSISIIHVAKNQLAMDDDSYRMMLKRLTGKSSSKELTERDFSRVMAEFRAKGFIEKPSSRRKGKPHNFGNLPAIITKMEALLADMKLEWSYADSMAKRMFKIDKVAWIKKEQQLHDIVAALYYKQQKDYYRAVIDDLCKKNNIAAEKKAEYLRYTKGGEWPERKKKFENIINMLSNL